ncbi:MAG: Transcriptional regulatory protein WalR [Spirochaetes bacterium ADurb.Bin215]|nr:MAG: Transcriptional regulatory protein WalR [Spirochaetes bacterium ADurb.Bin215]
MNKDIKNKRVQIFSALEVANMCGVVNQTAINWIRNGHLKAFNTPGGQYRVYKDDLITFIRNRGMRVPENLQDDDSSANWKSLIIIDDDTGLNNAIASYVHKNMPDLTILQSFDGFDAGAQLVEKKPGFVLLDLALPGVNGQEICKRIKTDPAFGKPFVMVITALTEDSLEQELYDLGADKFFRKPLVLSDLIDAINAEVEAS